MKPVYLSRHARRRMRLYDVSIEDIHETLRTPEHVAPTTKERYNAYKRMELRILRVTYKEEETRLVIVTVTPRREFEGAP